MKKIIGLLLLFLCTSVLVYPQSVDQKPSFRKLSWGMTKEEVCASEGIELLHEWSAGLYKLDSIENLFGNEAIVFYSFYQGKLVYAGYEFTDNSNDVYDIIGEKLRTKYGEPEYFDERIWIASRNYGKTFQEQCAQGKMRWESKWPLVDTIIYLRQEADGAGGIRLRLYYISADYDKSLQGGASDNDKL
jgi:hypothetical protein